MRVLSQDFNDGDKMPERHVFNGMGYQAIICRRTWHGMKCRPAPKALW